MNYSYKYIKIFYKKLTKNKLIKAIKDCRNKMMLKIKFQFWVKKVIKKIE